MAAIGTEELLGVLLEALPVLANSAGGIATITDAEGRWLMSVDPDGRKVSEPPFVVDLCRQAARERRVLTTTTPEDPPVGIWAIPLGSYVLAASNRYQAVHEHEVLRALREALPLIAYVAGGEAVIFDREGRRVASSLPDGSHHPDIGKIHQVFRETMAQQRPMISPSRTLPGVTSVRIPLTRNFGFGFNNAVTVRKDQELLAEVKKHQRTRYGWDDIVGTSQAIQRVVAIARKAAESLAPVLITGETGTGKELFAQAIHNGSPRRNGPFVAINCAALPASLVESQLFGYVDGAFTGARRGGQAGYFEEANLGTLLLDEISEMELPLQAKLLRVLQEKEVTRIGSHRAIRVDVRIIATSNRDLRRMVEAGKFREDLYYRLNVIELHLPPLRERPEDIPLLVEHFRHQVSRLTGKVITHIDPAALARIMAHRWPGNVRELYNCIERAFSVADGPVISPQHLPSYIGKSDHADEGEGRPTLQEAVRRTERDLIRRALIDAGGVRVRAAERLGISVSTLWRKMRELGFDQDFPDWG